MLRDACVQGREQAAKGQAHCAKRAYQAKQSILQYAAGQGLHNEPCREL